MKKVACLFLTAGLIMIFQLVNAQVYEPEFCGDITTYPLVDFNNTLVAGSVSIANDEDNLFITYEADPGWTFYTNYVYVGPLDAIPLSPSNYFAYYNYPNYYYSNIGITSNIIQIHKNDITMDDEGCFVVAVNANSENIGAPTTPPTYVNVYGNGIYSEAPYGYYIDYCWQECTTEVIEITGIGVHDLQISSLTFSDIGNIDHIVVEAIYKGNSDYNGPVEFSNNLGDVQSIEPVIGILDYGRISNGNYSLTKRIMLIGD